MVSGVAAVEVQPRPRDVVLAAVVDLDPPGALLVAVVDVRVHLVAGLLAVRLQPGPGFGPADLLAVLLLGDAEDLVAVAAGDVGVAVGRGVAALPVVAGRRAGQVIGGLLAGRGGGAGRVLGRHGEGVIRARGQAVHGQRPATARF